MISVAIEPKTKGDQDKLGAGLQRLTDEDPTFRVRTDDETGQTLISGMGELHLEIIVDRLMREFNVDANVGRPQVAYRETISKPVEKIEGKFVRQTGGRGQYGHVVINMEPADPGDGYEFFDKIVGGKIPREYIPSVDLGSRRRWSPASSPAIPVVDLRSHARRRLLPRRRLERDGLQGRGLDGLQDGRCSARSRSCSSRSWPSRSSRPRSTSATSWATSTRAAVTSSTSSRGATRRRFSARVPLATMFGYATDLRSTTQGRATFTMQFDRYEEVPQSIAGEIVDAETPSKRTGGGE